mgnify:CR=1 FL=1
MAPRSGQLEVELERLAGLELERALEEWRGRTRALGGVDGEAPAARRESVQRDAHEGFQAEGALGAVRAACEHAQPGAARAGDRERDCRLRNELELGRCAGRERDAPRREAVGLERELRWRVELEAGQHELAAHVARGEWCLPLQRPEALARSGNKDAARQLLDQLQSMLENLQMARPGAQGEDGEDDMMSALDELGDMIRKQQQLRDKTFKQGQEQRGQQRNQRGQPGQQGKQQFGDLRQDQQGLKDRLNKLLEQLRQRGLGNPGQNQKGQGEKGQGGNEMDQLGSAGDAMGEAEGQLGEGDADGAVDSQGRALEAMRKGAQGLAQSMQQNGMMGQGPGQPGRRGRQRADQDTDPLGRPLRGRDYGDDVTVKVPGEIDAQRARRILEELRKRFGEGFRPQLELDYIERLLKDF